MLLSQIALISRFLIYLMLSWFLLDASIRYLALLAWFLNIRFITFLPTHASACVVCSYQWIMKHVSSLWMEQADFSLEIGWWIEIEEAAHDTFNVNSNRSLFKLRCTRCLNFNHVLKTFVHDAIGLGKPFLMSSFWIFKSLLLHIQSLGYSTIRASSSYSPAKRSLARSYSLYCKKLLSISYNIVPCACH